MKITELVGIKKVQQAHQSHVRPSHWQDDLESRGWRPCGAGIMGMVWKNDRYPYVLKLFRADDSGYITFLKLAAANQSNPHFPKIRGKLVKLTEHIYAVRLEPLNSVDRNSDTWQKELGLICQRLAMRPGSPTWASDLAEPLVEKYHTLIDAFELVRQTAQENLCQLDTHAGNIMMRGTVPVITDPLI